MDQDRDRHREVEEAVTKGELAGGGPSDVDGGQRLARLRQGGLVDVDAPQSIGLDHVDEVAQIGADVAADLEHACRGKSRGMPRPEWSASTAGGGVAGHVLIAELAVPQLLEPRRFIDVAHGLTYLGSTVRLFVGTQHPV